MGATLRIIASGLASQQRNIDVIANNIANLQTPGFKKSRVEFKDLPYRPEALVQSEAEQTYLDEGLEGEGVRINATQLIFTQGALQETESPLDLALDGPGFFQVQLRDGTAAYTRQGSFTVDAQNRIVSQDGFVLAPSITLPEGTTGVRVDPDGAVWAQVADQEPARVGQITVARFANPEGLAALGHNLYAATEASGPATAVTPGDPGQPTLHSGMLEQGNVDLPDEISRLLQAQRAYQLGIQALRAWDQIAADAINVRR